MHLSHTMQLIHRTTTGHCLASLAPRGGALRGAFRRCGEGAGSSQQAQRPPETKRSSSTRAEAWCCPVHTRVSRSPFLPIIPTTPAWPRPPGADAPARSWVARAPNAETGRSFLSSPAAGTRFSKFSSSHHHACFVVPKPLSRGLQRHRSHRVTRRLSGGSPTAIMAPRRYQRQRSSPVWT